MKEEVYVEAVKEARRIAAEAWRTLVPKVSLLVHRYDPFLRGENVHFAPLLE